MPCNEQKWNRDEMMKKVFVGSRLLALFAIIALAGCSTPGVDFDISSTANLNMDRSGQPLPVVVRVYQLSDSKNFENASFSHMWKNDIETLGDSALTRQEVVVSPGSTKTVEMPKNDLANYVAVVALFHHPEGDKWRALAPLSHGYVARKFSSSVTVNLSSRSVSIAN